MATRRQLGNYCYVTWLTPLLSGEAQCWLQPWLRTQFQIEPVPDRGGFNLVRWQAEHADLVRQRAAELQQEGWEISLEDQNVFTLRGRAGTLAGKMDIVAKNPGRVRIVDVKTGRRKAADVHQVLIYMWAYPHISGRRTTVEGEVWYRDGEPLVIRPDDLTEELCQRIKDAILKVCVAAQPPAVPSARECAWCRVSKTDCPSRIDAIVEPATTEAF